MSSQPYFWSPTHCSVRCCRQTLTKIPRSTPVLTYFNTRSITMQINHSNFIYAKHRQSLPIQLVSSFMVHVKLNCLFQISWQYALCWTIDWNPVWAAAVIGESHTDVNSNLIAAARGTSLSSHTLAPYCAVQEAEIHLNHFPTYKHWCKIFCTNQGL